MDAQRRTLRRYCKLHELSLERVASDNGISGATIAKRDGLRGALADLEAGNADGLLVVKLDRLSRSVTDVLAIAGLAARQGWELHSVAEKIDTGTASGRFVLTVLAALSQMEREQVGERTRAALAELRQQGRRISGKPPWGYRFQDGDLVPDTDERAVVERMTALRGTGAGYKRIAAALGVNLRTGRPWTHTAVRSVLLRLQSATISG